MDNRKKRKNKGKNSQNPNMNTNTEVLNTQKEKADGASETKTEEIVKSGSKAVQKDNARNTEEKKTDTLQKDKKQDVQKNAAQQKSEKMPADNKVKQDAVKKEASKKESPQRENVKRENVQKESGKKEIKAATDLSSEHFRGIAINAAKILLPVAACAILIAVIISHIGSQESQTVDNQSLNAESGSDAVGAVTLSDEPLAENAYTDVNELMRAFYTAMADGDMDTVKALKDYNTDKEIITYKEKSEFIESYENINCYTKPGMEENSYFVYVTYDVKIKDIATQAPGLNAFYVYTSEDGSLKIDGDTEENIKAAFKLVTIQDDVVDLYNKINVSYTEATASDEALNQFMEELPDTIRESVGVALAQLAAQDEGGDTPQTESAAEDPGQTQPAETEAPAENEEPLQNKVVNQIVRTTDTVNVRSSDSEEADRIGKAQAGTELMRIEDRINGWSKVIFEDKEAFIKSDYLEVITTEVTAEPIGTIKATTNVNVRSQASQESEKLGTAQAGSSYSLLEDQGEWYKIDYNGTTGFVKAEFFER